MTCTIAAPTIPPRVRLDPERLPAHDLLAVLARLERARHPLPHPVEVVYSSGRRMNG
ncbi:hypothetical protein HCJ76_43965 [Streptomyces sp. MC1]|uniref:hypothetical protein n=1 Tax=Streptomyces sp. MC1 TaxID=295105 RepID=UPI0018CB1642|nr:hypothetical protein [Streptomyces sp. MC1]MBG7704840.1 hypothetical protein [Streptomyces sp. MC1]